MDKLESDLESFVRICHLHEKVDMLEHALAEKDREIAAKDQLLQSNSYEMTRLVNDYNQLMSQAVRFAEVVRAIPSKSFLHDDAVQFLTSSKVRTWREQEGL